MCFRLWTAQKHSFTFDKVFLPNTTQEDVFIEISQLVQSALDGYKVMKMETNILFVAFFFAKKKKWFHLFAGNPSNVSIET